MPVILLVKFSINVFVGVNDLYCLSAARRNRIIPVLLDVRLVMPDILLHITVCDYTKPDLSIRNHLKDEIGLDIVAQRRPQQMEIQNYSANSRKENDSTAKRFLSRIHNLVTSAVYSRVKYTSCDWLIY